MGGGALLGSLLLATAVQALRRPQDIILQAKCLLQCERAASPALGNYKDYVYKCAKECLLRGWEQKPGDCPARGPKDHSMACIAECRSDAQCASFDKCCRHSCGQTCMPPSGLQFVPGLPEIVTEIRHVERKRLGVVVVTWGSGPRALSLRRASIRLPAPEVYYVVEERRLAGATLRPNAMGPWSPAHRAPKPNPRAKLKLKPGHWYQLRIAAVGINGTRGFSLPTPHFKLSTKPSPASSPLDLMMSNLVKRNGTVSGLLSWDPPEYSDLPLLGYNVQWTQIRGSPPYSVSKRLTRDKTSVKLRHLEPDSTYEMVVEAISQYDKETLTSVPAKLTINTTTYTKRSPVTRGERSRQKSMSLTKSKPVIADGKVAVTVSWKSTKPYEKFVLSWEALDCNGNSSKNLITPETKYEVRGLDFGCKYSLAVRDKPLLGRRPRRIGRLTFTTPPCTAFKLHFC